MTASRFFGIFSVFCLLYSPTVLAQFGSTVQYFPQFAIDGGARTFFTVHNPGENDLTVDLTLIRSNGSTHYSEAISVAAGATETVSYGEPGGTPTAGWAKLTSGSEFTATLFYQIAGVGNVGVLPSPEAKVLKVFTYAGGNTQTGFAVANPSETEGSILTFEIYASDGSLERELSWHLDHREHRAFFFSESPYDVEDNGSVTIRATNPVIALALRLDGSLLSSVGVVVPGLPIRGEWTGESPNIIGGYRENRVSNGMVGGIIAGGGNSSGVQDGGPNFVTGDYGTVGGGKRNTADDLAAVGGGDLNVASGGYSTVGGGSENTASDTSSTVGGGANNTASGQVSTVSGGVSNTANAELSTVSGGYSNTANGYASTIGGGFTNSASGSYSTVGGGYFNIASGISSTVAGGFQNVASESGSFAAGSQAEALHAGTFVWADDRNTPFRSTSPRQFLVRALGGVGINTNSPQGTLDVNGSIYQHGNVLHADYVFEPDYKLESIQEHSRLMWGKKHLPALQAGEKDEQGQDVVEYGSRMRGILEELEKAHVYIEQLNRELLSQREEITMDVFQHVLPDMQEDAASALDSVLSG